MIVIKRNNSKTRFDKVKIKDAVEKAMRSCGFKDFKPAMEIAEKLEKQYEDLGLNMVKVSVIEKDVFMMLTSIGLEEVARSYEGYRAVQEYKRINNTTDDSILGLVRRTNVDVLEENSNKNALVASTQRDLIAGEVSKDIARRKLVPAYQIQAHDEGAIHIHDMDYLMQPIHNCCLINLEDMLNNGTVINGKLVETPKSFATACTVATQIVAQVASNQYGGQSITIKHIAPFLRVSYDKYLNKYKELGFNEEQTIKIAEDRMREELIAGIQTIRYQLSTLQTSNGQAPFVTIYLEIIEGDEFEKEQALICEEMVRQRLQGMKNEKGQEIGESFPKLVYVLDEHNCLKGGKYDYITELCAKCNVKRLVPDYQSAKIMRANYDGDNFPPMGCRSHLSVWKDENGNNKWYGRFNIGVVSVNLPQIGLLANGDMEKFWNIFEQRMELCKDTLMTRIELLKGTPANTSPIHWQHGALARLKANETIDSLLEGGYATVSLGYVGVYECVQAMLKQSHTTKEGEKFALEIVRRMKECCDTWKEETGYGFGLYGTPAESLIYRFCRLDTKVFGKVPNVTDKLYYTNSYHVHVTEEIDAFSKLAFESQFHAISSGGCISYVEVPNLSKNVDAVKDVIRFIYDNVQYAEINTKSDVCYECGFDGEMQIDDNLDWYCPSCGNRDKEQMQVLRRTCGYIGSSLWNKGKTQEIKERVLHL